MTAIRAQAVTKSFGAIPVLKTIDLEIEAGEFVVIVGPSGCGKSTFLRLLSGLETLTSGRIFFGDRDVTRLDPGKRRVAMVFQSYALYPHMTVAENIGFATRVHGASKAETAARVAGIAATLQLTDCLGRRPAALSGGQKQRVAIGRAIIRDPQVFLFDEPLSNLDADLRVEMRLELTALHKRLGRTMIHVTHDQVEAMTLADRIVILRDGKLEQVGAPKTLYHDPDNIFVAGFLGTPKMSFLRATVASATAGGSRATLDTDPDIALDLAVPLSPGRQVQLGIRPGNLRPADRHPGHGMTLPAVPGIIEDPGGSVIAWCQTAGGARLTAQLPAKSRLDPGIPVAFSVQPDDILVFDAPGGARLRRDAVPV